MPGEAPPCDSGTPARGGVFLDEALPGWWIGLSDDLAEAHPCESLWWWIGFSRGGYPRTVVGGVVLR